jgi:TolA-binding protein
VRRDVEPPRTRVLPAPVAAPARRPVEVLFEEGWRALAAGELDRAAERFEQSARSAPQDPLAEDAWFWNATTLARAGRATAATDALEAFLGRYPRSPRRGEASAVLGWLLLDAGDVAGAEARFRAAADDRVETVRASAKKGLEAISRRR